MRSKDERGAPSTEAVVIATLLVTGVAVGAPVLTVWLGMPMFMAALLVALALVGTVVVCLIAAEAWSHRRLRDEHGAASTGMVVVLGVALLVVGGLVIDGGYTLGARREAMNQAEQAARAGSDALNEGSLRDGTIRVDPGRAVAAANAYLARVGAHGRVSVNGDEVTVTVTSRQDTKILSIVGVGSFPVKATASAVSIDEDD
jgi:hypothetical protein